MPRGRHPHKFAIDGAKAVAAALIKRQKTEFPLPGIDGLTYDPIGAHVVMRRMGKDILGEVIGVYQNQVTKCWHLRVKYFNGELWPIEPNIGAVEVLLKDYDDA